MKIAIFLFMFFVLSGFYIIGNEKLSLKDSVNREKFVGFYFNWLSDLFENTKSITGYVFKLDWLPNSEVKYVE